jgi:hypothetical protein
MWITELEGSETQHPQRRREANLSTDPCQFYVSYLTADALAAAVADIDRKLSTKPRELSTRQVQVLRGVRQDMLRELGRRQLTFELNGDGAPTRAG